MIGGLQRFGNRIIRRLSSDISSTMSICNKSYEEAVVALNTLQSNAATVEKIKEQKDAKRHVQIAETVQTAERAGVSIELIDKLSVIHVSGTKGKGSTCAFCESILRNHGYKTGFFSSPHLIEVRERIRINGKPIAHDAFTTYFWDCYQPLEDSKDKHDGDMPAYFRFLTVMAFHVFIQEKVDVAIMEVGIGGQYDSTNIVRAPVVCGVSSLGLDHTNILGPTLEHIAWHKAGIFKPGVPAVTVPQSDGCLQVLKERAAEIENPLYLSPSYSAYDWGDLEPCKLGIDGEMQKVNASLALQLCHIWLQDHSLDRSERLGLYSGYTNDRIPSMEDAKTFKVSSQSKAGLESCRWAGRNQKVVRPGVTYYIDGAHTDSSVQQCISWFLPEARLEAKQKRSVARVLMFNLTGDREPETLLRHLVKCEFDAAVFCPNIASVSKVTARTDQCNLLVTPDTQCCKCVKNRNTWLELNAVRKLNKLKPPASDEGSAKPQDTLQHNLDHNQVRDTKVQQMSASDQTDSIKLTGVNQNNNNIDKPAVSSKLITKYSEESLGKNIPEDLLDQEHSALCNTIEEAVHWINQERRDPMFNTKWEGPELSPTPKVLKEAEHIQVLCIGSLHLVGGLIGLLKADINES